jgi:hypothetical protein
MLFYIILHFSHLLRVLSTKCLKIPPPPIKLKNLASWVKICLFAMIKIKVNSFFTLKEILGGNNQDVELKAEYSTFKGL